MVQRLAGNADAGIGHVGEIRQRLLSRHMVLTEDHLAIGAVFRAPGTNPALQAPTQPIPVMIGMTALHLLEYGNRSQTRMRLDHRTDLPSHKPSNGSGPLRLRWPIGCGGRCRAVSTRRAVRSLNPAFAAATCCGWCGRNFMNNLFCWLVTCRPGNSALIVAVEKPIWPARRSPQTRTLAHVAG